MTARMKYVGSSAATCSATATSVHHIFHRSSFVRAVQEGKREREKESARVQGYLRSAACAGVSICAPVRRCRRIGFTLRITDGLVSYSSDFYRRACQDNLKKYLKKERKKSRKIYITLTTNGLI